MEEKGTKKKTTFDINTKKYKWIVIKGKQEKAELVDKIPSGFSYYGEHLNYAVFSKQNIVTNKIDYVIIPKKIFSGEQKQKETK